MLDHFERSQPEGHRSACYIFLDYGNALLLFLASTTMASEVCDFDGQLKLEAKVMKYTGDCFGISEW